MSKFEGFVVLLIIGLILSVLVSSTQGMAYEEAAFNAFEHAHTRMSVVDSSDDVALKQACEKDEHEELTCLVRKTGRDEKFVDVTFQSDRVPLWFREHRQIRASAQVRLKPYVDKFYLVKN